MAHLFSKIVLKDALKNISIPDIEEKISVLTGWNEMYKKGELQRKNETEFEATYSEKLFGTVLGYNDVSSGLYTREKHPKNSSNGQKCDIGLGYYSSEKNETQAVVELKDAGTSIDRPQQREGNMTPIQQGFKYKPLYNSRWVIVSNYYEIRLYRDTYQDYEVWTLADLVNSANDYEKFRIFYFLLRAESLISETGESETEKLLAKVRIEQETITKKFYKEYSGLREELMRDIWKHNPALRNESVVTITQRIIDRIVFIHFCEDRLLLPSDKLKENLTRAKEAGFTPWEILMVYFRGIDKGSEKLGIPDGYNGGLFRDEDEVIKNLKVSDEVITKFIELGRYDFSDEGGQLSVEILGHIFEQSISDLESIRAKIKNPGGASDEKKVSKRKKDGIFYTPAYIVDYIVRNSLGKYLEENEERLKEQFKLKGDINEKNYRKRELEAYTEYQKILHKVKVVDPACGSGAFLVRVFDFLISENVRVDKILSGDEQTLSLAERDPSAFFGEILKNNIYGVDLNEESVEITKLSLWLKSAVRGKKLETLDNNIKCGNSLIDDPVVAGDKAFNWHTEFAEIMASGGFNVIVGNPPYVLSRNERFDNEKEYFQKTYKLFNEKPNLYILFMERADSLLKEQGSLGFIVPNSWLGIDSGLKIRKYLLENVSLKKIISLKGESFSGVSVETVIFTYKKTPSKNSDILFSTVNGIVDFDVTLKSVNSGVWLKNRNYIFDLQSNDGETYILAKISSFTPLSQLYDVRVGLQAYEKGKGLPKQTEVDVKNHIFDYDYKFDENTYPYLGGGDVARYSYSWSGQWLRHGKWLSQPKEFEQFSQPRILIREITSLYPRVLNSTYFEDVFLNNKSIINVLCKDQKFSLKFLLCLLNSQLISFYHSRLAVKGNRTLFPKVVVKDVQNYPIPETSLSEQRPFIEKADLMLSLNRDMQEKSSSFLRNIQAKYSVSKITRKLEKWWELDFAEFLKETKISISLAEQEELMSYFETRRTEVRAIDVEIRKTDTEIDNMVFELYGLTVEDRAIVLLS